MGTATIAGQARATIKSNTQIELPGRAAIGDVDGDGLQDLVYPAGNRILATKVKFRNTGILHRYEKAQVERLVVGHFEHSTKAAGIDQVCALMDNGKMRCFRSSDDRRELRSWFEQASPIADDEEAIVADFDGDGVDDILRYRPATGALALLRYDERAKKFVPETDIAFGMPANTIKHKQLRAGEFDGNAKRADLLIWDRKTGKVSRYDTVLGKSGLKMTHRFTTSRVVVAGETLHVANLDGTVRDGVALSRPSGQFRFFRAKQSGTRLAANSVPHLGQLSSKGGGAPFFGHFEARDSEPGRRRDDVVLHRSGPKTFTRMNARWDAKAKRHTYWWSYTSRRPTVHEGWPKKKVRTMVVLKCRLEGNKAKVGTDEDYRLHYGYEGRGQKGLWDYVRDLSYGTQFVTTEVKSGWKDVGKTEAQLAALEDRADRVRVCTKAWGVDPSKYDTTMVIYNGKSDFGATGRRIISGKKALQRNNAIYHEVLHSFGLPHAFDTSERKNADWAPVGAYYDEFDPMGGIDLLSGEGPLGQRPPHTSGYFKSKIGMMPSSRIKILEVGSKKKTKVVKLAPLNRPEVNGPMLLKIGLRGSDDELVVEYREPWEWDEGLDEPGVIVRRVKVAPKKKDRNHKTKGRVTYLPRDAPGPLLTKGETLPWGGVTIKVLKLDSVEGRAEIEVRY